ncbi:unnamed protein product [Amoebophrya sp. A120]|nr:unnamed protein product [Amoebophrya sp. A120]|eukprot:GSA120T00019994001.1
MDTDKKQMSASPSPFGISLPSACLGHASTQTPGRILPRFLTFVLCPAALSLAQAAQQEESQPQEYAYSPNAELQIEAGNDRGSDTQDNSVAPSASAAAPQETTGTSSTTVQQGQSQPPAKVRHTPDQRECSNNWLSPDFCADMVCCICPAEQWQMYPAEYQLDPTQMYLYKSRGNNAFFCGCAASVPDPQRPVQIPEDAAVFPDASPYKVLGLEEDAQLSLPELEQRADEKINRVSFPYFADPRFDRVTLSYGLPQSWKKLFPEVDDRELKNWLDAQVALLAKAKETVQVGSVTRTKYADGQVIADVFQKNAEVSGNADCMCPPGARRQQTVRYGFVCRATSPPTLLTATGAAAGEQVLASTPSGQEENKGPQGKLRGGQKGERVPFIEWDLVREKLAEATGGGGLSNMLPKQSIRITQNGDVDAKN